MTARLVIALAALALAACNPHTEQNDGLPLVDENLVAFDDTCMGQISVHQYVELRQIAREYPALRPDIREALESGDHVDPCEFSAIEFQRDNLVILALRHDVERAVK